VQGHIGKFFQRPVGSLQLAGHALQAFGAFGDALFEGGVEPFECLLCSLALCDFGVERLVLGLDIALSLTPMSTIVMAAIALANKLDS
jgi:hypothetical protein